MKHQRQDEVPWLPAEAAGLVTLRPARAPQEVTILLALHDGARYIDAQLDSLARQTHPHWRLFVSDDGSRDDGLMRVATWAASHPERKVQLMSGPCAGFARNFLHLLAAVESSAPYTAFSDQDDVWLPEKLSRAVAALAEVPAAVPALYCAGRIVTDAGLGRPRQGENWVRSPAFANALVQNIAPGNTLLMNRAALRLLQAAGRRVARIPAHDWWAYLMVTGAGGRVIRDTVPGLLYRQHDCNTVGARRGLRGALRMLRFGLSGNLRRWQDQNIEALDLAYPYLTREARSLLEGFARARRLSWHRRPAALRRLGIFRQTRSGTLGLWLTSLFGLL